MLRGIAGRLVLASIAVALLPFHARGETLAELYEKAKADKEIVFYSGGPAAPHESRAKLFMQQYPGIEVKVTGGFSNVLNAEIEKQMAAKRLAVDMAFFQTVQDFVTWKQQGKLMSFRPDGFEQIYPNFKDPDGAYMSFSANALTYAYNTAAVKPEDAPKSALDFLKPMFAGKLITCYPADDDATLYLFHIIIQKYGWNWMTKYTANKPNYVQGHLPVARSVATGENIATFDASSSVWEFRRQGKLDVVWSGEDETPVFTLTGGIFKDAPHPNAAKLYMTWFLAKEQQSRVGSFSSRQDVAPPEGFKPLTSYKIANNYREFMVDEKLIESLRKRMEGFTGPVVNKGGVR
ncbi:ABC transporter substrate-binding protein [Rhodoplanes sp. Z2-YC6860]|uniref:ABC transporter substrate-binding protein n=1 Tax=Rhodoplanes sp. Z2-YC6860 TaxID=674703 RepID=UPI00078BF298|nr:extracellular solute-binding protein [Rhodoplanes sp. Z2-YC6860]AMN44230.1 family 1 extracellular solute-binding protein [Rhodoplanes sp. Z2-YC6860]